MDYMSKSISKYKLHYATCHIATMKSQSVHQINEELFTLKVNTKTPSFLHRLKTFCVFMDSIFELYAYSTLAFENDELLFCMSCLACFFSDQKVILTFEYGSDFKLELA